MSDIAPRNATRLHRTPFPTTLCWFVTNAAAAMLVKRTYLYPFAQELNSFVCKIGYGHSSGKPGCGARVQEHRHAPEIGHKAGVRGQDRSLLRSRSGRSHAILPAPTNLFQSEIHSLNSFSTVLRFVNSYQWAARFIVCYCIRCTNHRKTLTGQSHDVLLWKGMGDTPKKTSESNSKCFICSSIPTSKKQGLCIWKNFHRFSRSHLIFGRIWREKIRQGHQFACLPTVFPPNQVR